MDEALAPFPGHALGWFCLGCHLSDSPGRAECIARLLLRAGLAQPRASLVADVGVALQRILRTAPQWIALQPTVFAQVAELRAPGEPEGALSEAVEEWAGFNGAPESAPQSAAHERVFPA
eukprot:7067877-Alexandrium_andersonii.AAC.1